MSNKTNASEAVNNFFQNIDWVLFYQEKMALLEVISLMQQGETEKEQNAAIWLDGLANMLDAMGDAAEEAGLFQYPERDEDDRCLDDRFNDILAKKPADEI